MLTNEAAVKLLSFLESTEANKLELTLRASLAVARNKRRLQEFVKTLQEIETKQKAKSKRIDEFNEKKIKALDSFLEKDETGKAIILKDGSLKLKDGVNEEVTIILNKLNEEYKEEIESYNSKIAEWNKFFYTEEADLEIDMISIDDIDVINGVKLKKEAMDCFVHMVDLGIEEEIRKKREKSFEKDKETSVVVKKRGKQKKSKK